MLKHQVMQLFGRYLKKISIFHPLEVVGRGSETQLQIDKLLSDNTLYIVCLLSISRWTFITVPTIGFKKKLKMHKYQLQCNKCSLKWDTIRL